MKRTLCTYTHTRIVAPYVSVPENRITTKNAVRSREGEAHGCNSTQSERLHLIKQDSNLQKNEN